MKVLTVSGRGSTCIQLCDRALPVPVSPELLCAPFILDLVHVDLLAAIVLRLVVEPDGLIGKYL